MKQLTKMIGSLTAKFAALLLTLGLAGGAWGEEVPLPRASVDKYNAEQLASSMGLSQEAVEGILSNLGAPLDGYFSGFIHATRSDLDSDLDFMSDVTTSADSVFVFTPDFKPEEGDERDADEVKDALLSQYGNYGCDFVVSFDESVDADSVVLTGCYNNMIFSILMGMPFEGNNATKQFLISSVGFNFTYDDIVTKVGTFICTATTTSKANIGKTINVSLVIWPEGGDKETDSKVIATIPYKFTKVDPLCVKIADEYKDLEFYSSGNNPDSYVISGDSFVKFEESDGPHFAAISSDDAVLVRDGEEIARGTVAELLKQVDDNAETKDVIKILKNLALSSGVQQINKKLVIDLNGFAYGCVNSPLGLGDSGDVTIRDSVGGGYICRLGNINDMTSRSTGACLSINKGRFVLESGKIDQQTGTALTASGTGTVEVKGGVVDGATTVGSDNGTFILSGGKIIRANGENLVTLTMNGGNLTVKGGEIVGGEGTSTGVRLNSGKMTLENGLVVGRNAIDVRGGELVVTGGEVTSENGTAIYASQGSVSSVVSVSGGVVKSVSGVAISTGKCTLTISDEAKVSGETNAIIGYDGTEMTISGGTISSETGNAVWANGKVTLAVSSGEISSKSGTAVFVEPKATATISGGKLTTISGTRPLVMVRDGGKLAISDGVFHLGDPASQTIIGVAGNTLDSSAVSEIAVSGGYFTKKVADNHLASGYVNLTVSSGTPEPWKVGQAAAKVGDLNYETLQEALDAAQEGDMVKLIADVVYELTSTSTIGVTIDKSITLDGNGHKITLTGEYAGDTYGINVDSTAAITPTFKNLTITASGIERAVRFSGAAGGTLDNVTLTTDAVGIHIKGTGDVEISNSSITTKPKDNTHYTYHLRSAVMHGSSATVTLTDNTIVAQAEISSAEMEHKAKGVYIGTRAVGTMVLESGNAITADIALAIDGAETGAGAGPSNKNHLIVQAGNTVTGAWASTGYKFKLLTIDGGDYYDLSTPDPTTLGKADSDGNLQISITGGTFPIDVTAYCAEGYTCVLSGNRYVVQVAAGKVARNVEQNKAYASLADAFADAQDGDTVQLLKDVEDQWYPQSAVPSNLTIDLGGNTLTGRIVGWQQPSMGGLVVKNGTISSGDNAPLWFYGSGAITAKDLTIVSNEGAPNMFASGSSKLTLQNVVCKSTLEGNIVAESGTYYNDPTMFVASGYLARKGTDASDVECWTIEPTPDVKLTLQDGTVTTYRTVSEAVAAAATAGQTATVEAFEGTYEIPATISIPEGLTLKGAGAETTVFKITTTNGDGVKITKPNVTISNATINGSAVTSSGYNTLINVEADGAVIDSVVMTGGGQSTWNSSILVEGINAPQTFTVKNSTISGSFRGVLRESCDANIVIENCDIDAVYPFNIDGGNGGTVTVADSALHGWTSYSGVEKVTFTNCEFTKGSYDRVVAYVDTEFDGCSFDGEFEVIAQIQTSPFTFTFKNCTKNGETVTQESFTNQFSYSDVWVKCDTYVDGKLVGAVAAIGTAQYKSLQSAVDAAAADGDTVQIIKAGVYTLPNLPNNITIEDKVGGVIFEHIKQNDFDLTTGRVIASVPNGATFKNVKFLLGAITGVSVNYHGFTHAGKIVMDGCSIDGLLFSYGDMTFTNCSFNQSNSDYHMWAYAGNLTYTDCTFTNTGTGKFINVYNEDGKTKYTVKVDKCKFVNKASAANKAALNVKDTCGDKKLAYDVYISNSTTDGAFPTASTSENSDGTKLVVYSALLQVDDIATGDSYINVAEAPASMTFDQAGKIIGGTYVVVDDPLIAAGYVKVPNAQDDKLVDVVPGAVITYVVAHGEAPAQKAVPFTDGKYTLTEADLPTLTVPGYVFTGWDKSAGETITGPTTITALWQAVAQIGTTKYDSLQAALNDAATASADVTVEILEDIDLTGATWTPVYLNGYTGSARNIVIQGSGKYITGLTAPLIRQTWSSTSIKFYDLTVKNSEISGINCEGAGSTCAAAFVGCVSCSTGTVIQNCNVINCTIKDAKYCGAFIGYAAGYSNQNNGPVFSDVTITGGSVEGCTITGVGSSGALMGHATGDAWTLVSANGTVVKNNSITGETAAKTGILFGTAGAGQTYDNKNGGVIFSVTESGNKLYVGETQLTGDAVHEIGRIGSRGGTVTVTEGGSYSVDPTITSDPNTGTIGTPEDYEVTQKDDGFYTVTAMPAVAKIGDTTYTSLQKALDAAHEMTGDVTVELVADISGYSIVHQKAGLNLTIDGKDKTVAGQIIIDGDGSASGTETLTIQNVKFEGDKSNFYTDTDAFILVPSTKDTGTLWSTGKYNYAHNVTAKDCSFTSTSSELNVVGIKATSHAGLYNLLVSNTTGSNLHSFAQLTGTTGSTFTDCEVTESKSFVNISGGGGDQVFTGCTFVSSAQGGYAVRMKGASSAAVALDGNTFEADSVIWLGEDDAPTGTITVNGGSYKGAIVSQMSSAGTATYAIKGGIYSEEPNADFIVEGYLACANTDADTKEAYPFMVAAGYKVTFKNWDDSVLYTVNVPVGETPIYKGETPAKPADANFVYTFSGWDPAIAAVSNSEQIYTAQFTSAVSVAKIGDNYYASLASAVEAVPATGDATTIQMLAADTLAEYVAIPANKNIVLDLNGQTVTATNGGLDLYGTLKVVDGTTEKNGKFTAGTWGIWANQGADLLVSSGTVEGGKWAIVAQGADTMVKVEGGTVYSKDGTAISGIGNSSDSGYTIEVAGGEVVSDTDIAIYHPNGKKLTVSGGTVSGATAIYQKAGTLEITGGTITGTGAATGYVFNDNGANATGDALVVENCGYPGGVPVVSITGGTFRSTNAKAVGSYAKDSTFPALTGFISPTGTALFSDDVSDGVPAGYELVPAGEGYDGLYKLAPLTGILYVTGKDANGKNRGVMMDVDWLRANGFIKGVVATQAELDGMQAALSESGDNGLPYWQSYVLGVDPNGTYPLTIAKGVSSGENYIITGKFAGSTGFNLTPSKNATMTVEFTLVQRGAFDADAKDWAWTKVNGVTSNVSDTAAPQFTVSMDAVANQVLAISVTIMVDDKK